MSAMDTTPEVISPPAGGAVLGRLREAAKKLVGTASTLLLIIIFFSVTQEQFMTWDNIETILRTATPLAIVAIGMTFVMIGGGFDLSVGSMAALAGVLLAEQLDGGMAPGLVIPLVAIECFLIGYFINGFAIGKLHLNFFVVTLATFSIYRGLALLIADGKSTSTFEWAAVQKLGDGEVLGVSVPIALTALLFVIAAVVLRKTKFGRKVYAIGGNEEAARISGIAVERTRMALYGISAMMAGIGGMVLTGRLTSSQPVTGGIGLELQAAAAVLLGGTKFTGGAGTVVGTLIGALYIQVLTNGLSIAGVQDFWQQVATGVILFLAVGFDRLQRRGEA
jgi:ribose transport system permease protein